VQIGTGTPHFSVYPSLGFASGVATPPPFAACGTRQEMERPLSARWEGAAQQKGEVNTRLSLGFASGQTEPAKQRGRLAHSQTLNISISRSDQYSLIALFSILGGSLLMSSLDLLSMYLSIELQSFALYILATLNKERLSATSAGLKYFLLGSLSSCFILLGSAIIYSYTGLTQFEAINTLLSVPSFNHVSNFAFDQTSVQGILPFQSTLDIVAYPNGAAMQEAALPQSGVLLSPETMGNAGRLRLGLIEMLDINKAFTIGLIIIIIGFLFKISAAPFYQWAPDVYDGTPTIVTV